MSKTIWRPTLHKRMRVCVSGRTGSCKHERCPLFLPGDRKKWERECIFKSYNFPNNYYNLYWPNCPKGKLYIYLHIYATYKAI